MAKYYIVERQACVVTWRFPVEANSAAEAYEKYGNGEHGEAEGAPEIGDSIDAYQFDLDLETEGTAIMPDGTRLPWDERLRAAGASYEPPR
jgi:hypothetical protein